MKSSPHKKDRFIHFAWIILMVCFVNLFISYGIRLSYSMVLPELIRDMSLTRREGGDIFNAYIFAYICLSPVAGYLADRVGARKVICVFGIILGAGTILMGTARHFSQAAAFFALVGIGAAAMWAPVITLVQRWFSVRKRGMAVGFLSVGYGLGFAAMGYIFPLIVINWGWQHFFFIMGTAALFMVTVNALFIRGTPAERGVHPWGEEMPERVKGDTTPSASNRRKVYREILATGHFWVIGLSYALIGAALYLVTTFMVDYARHELGFDLTSASRLATFHGMGQIIGVLTIPLLSDYLGRRVTIIFSNIFIAAAIFGIIFVGGNYLWLLLNILALGIFYGATFPLYAACGGDYFPKDIMATVIGALVPFYGIGAILAHRLGGGLRDAMGSFFLPFILAVLMALAAGFLMWFLQGRAVTAGGSV